MIKTISVCHYQSGNIYRIKVLSKKILSNFDIGKIIINLKKRIEQRDSSYQCQTVWTSESVLSARISQL